MAVPHGSSLFNSPGSPSCERMNGRTRDAEGEERGRGEEEGAAERMRVFALINAREKRWTPCPGRFRTVSEDAQRSVKIKRCVPTSSDRGCPWSHFHPSVHRGVPVAPCSRVSAGPTPTIRDFASRRGSHPARHNSAILSAQWQRHLHLQPA